MKPYILDLREQRCPMALLIAKREICVRSESKFIILIRDHNSMSDIVRFFDKNGLVTHVEDISDHYQITVNRREPI